MCPHKPETLRSAKLGEKNEVTSLFSPPCPPPAKLPWERDNFLRCLGLLLTSQNKVRGTGPEESESDVRPL